uniref:Uncharacterized protein n=1 Tax=Meloidogyne incognita TaxID=6306 RepID=A0A914L2M3_MELIC
MAEWHKQGKEVNGRPYRRCSVALMAFFVCERGSIRSMERRVGYILEETWHSTWNFFLFFFFAFEAGWFEQQSNSF